MEKPPLNPSNEAVFVVKNPHFLKSPLYVPEYPFKVDNIPIQCIMYV